MKKSEYLNRALEARDSGRIDDSTYDAMLMNAEVFCDDDDEAPDTEDSTCSGDEEVDIFAKFEEDVYSYLQDICEDDLVPLWNKYCMANGIEEKAVYTISDIENKHRDEIVSSHCAVGSVLALFGSFNEESTYFTYSYLFHHYEPFDFDKAIDSYIMELENYIVFEEESFGDPHLKQLIDKYNEEYEKEQ